MSALRTAFVFPLLCCTILASAAFQQSSVAHDLLIPSPLATAGDVPDIEAARYSLSDSMKASLNTLKQLETLPSCNKIAAAALVHSCSTLDGTILTHNDEMSHGTDLLLSEEISIYAARLAVCELNSARAPVPPACKAFVPTNKTTKKASWAGHFTGKSTTTPRQLYPEYDAITEHKLGQCLSALAACPQAWTSFSNSKQTAVVMCHSMRGEIEKDQQIHLYKVLASTTQEVVDELFRSKRDWEAFRAGFSDLSTGMRDFHLELVRENQETLEVARRLWVELQTEVQAGLLDISRNLQHLRSEAGQAGESLSAAHRDIEQNLQHASEVARSHAIDLHEMTRGLATGVELTEYLQTLIQDRLVQVIYNMTHNLEVANDISMSLRDEQVKLRAEVIAVTDDLTELSSNLRELSALSDTLSGNWLGLLEVCGWLVLYTAIYSLLFVGLWQRFMPVFGSVCASLATGGALAFTTTFYFSPLDALRYTRHYFSVRDNAPRLGVVAAIVLGSLLTVFVLLRLLQCLLPNKRSLSNGTGYVEELPHIAADVKTFRLPINDPKLVAGMAQKRALRGW